MAAPTPEQVVARLERLFSDEELRGKVTNVVVDLTPLQQQLLFAQTDAALKSSLLARLGERSWSHYQHAEILQQNAGYRQ